MPKESTIQHYTSSTTGSVPTSGNLASGELAINTADEKIFYKNHAGTVLSLSETKDLSGTFAHGNEVVSSVNGVTGAITNVAKTNTAQTFTQLQEFTSGISASGDLTVDTKTFFVDSTNNRIGVNTATPAYQVEIENTGANALLVLDRTDGAACFIEGQATRSAFGSVGATPLVLAYNSLAVVEIGAGGAITVNPDGGDPFTFPTSDGNANQYLQTDGSGTVSWASAVQSFNGSSGAVTFVDYVSSVNGATGAVTFTVPLATTSVTGTASFNPNRFQVSATGNVDLLAAYQATGDTVITVAGSGIGISTSGKTDTLYNIGVTSFNSLTGNISFTGDGGSSLVLGNTVVTNRIATTAATGVASFNSTYFTVSNGAVSLAAAYQATGSGIATVPLATTSLTGTASFNSSDFTVATTGHVRIKGLGSNGEIPFISSIGGLTSNSALQYDLSNYKMTVAYGPNPSRNFSLETQPTVGYLNANGAIDFAIGHAAGGLISIGDYDGSFNSTRIDVNIGSDTIDLFSASNPVTIDSAGLTVSSWMTVGGGATFNSNVTMKGNTTLGDAATDTTTIYGTKIVNEGVYANGSLRTANISFANGQVQTLTGVGTGATGTTAIYFTDAPSTGAASVTMIITNGGLMTGTGMTAWGGNIKWPGGIKPVLSSSGIDVVSFVTPDAGSTIYGFVGGLNFT